MAPNSPIAFLRTRKNPDLRFGFFLFLAGALIAATAFAILEPSRPRPRSPYVSPPQLVHAAFGAKAQIADTLWLRAIQDFDFCEQPVAKHLCRSEGWLFRMLDLITDLAPEFRMPYAAGGVALTVLVSDIQGASRIFDKGVKAFPQDSAILSRAAYHALYEEKDNAKAARLLEQAGRAGGPPWYFMLAARLYGREGETELAEEMIRQIEAEPHPDPVLLKTLRGRLEQMRAARGAPH